MEEAAPQTREQIGGAMIDFAAGPLKAVSLTLQLVAGVPSASDGTVRADIRPVITSRTTVGSIPSHPGTPSHHGRHEHWHVTGSRALAGTSGTFINLSSSSASGAPVNYSSSILVPDNTEHVKDGASDRIIEEAMMVAARQPFYFPPRANGADWSIYRSIP